MLIDELDITFKAGDGGDGIVSFGKRAKSGPDGGNGGSGGDLYIEASTDLTLLGQFSGKKLIAAEDGQPGDRNKKTGKDGNDLTIKLPIGSKLIDKNTGTVFELTRKGQKMLICEGGEGGIGNFDLRSSVNTSPKRTIPPQKGQIRDLHISMSFIADYGLIGLPSAGKSSLLNELTNARAKTAEYHFTTLSPNLGVLPNTKKIIADIPGLIEGASGGKGLGIKFLKHIERVSLLLHCIAANSKNHFKDYDVVRGELEKFNPDLLKKTEIILLTKHDLIEQSEVKRLADKMRKKLKKEVVAVSIYDDESINKLNKILITLLKPKTKAEAKKA